MTGNHHVIRGVTGNDLRIIRLNKGKSIRGLARELNIPEQSIRRIEDGDGIRVDRAKTLADFYGVLVTDLPAFRESVETPA